MPKIKEKHLLVISFLEGKNFTKRNKVKFVVEAKFDGEQLATDPVEHNEVVEINQELAWELDKKSLHMHRLQRSAIKAICYAITDSTKENIGYVVLDIRSAPEGMGKPKWHNLLQPKYPKLKPSVQINLYVESDQPVQLSSSVDTLSQQMNKVLSSANASLNNSIERKSMLKINLIPEEGYFQIENPGIDCDTYVLTITIAFARNLFRLVKDQQSSGHFYFVYKFLNNQVTTKPFEDIISCQINAERSSIRLHSNIENLKKFIRQENDLEISFCSNDRIVAKTTMSWKNLLEQWKSSTLTNAQNSLTVDYLLKFVNSIFQTGRQSPMDDISPIIGVQVSLSKENENQQQNLPTDDNSKTFETDNFKITSFKNKESIVDQNRESPEPSSGSLGSSSSDSAPNINETQDKIIPNEKSKEKIIKPKTTDNQNFVVNNGSELGNHVSQEMQLKAAYEIECWKEAREKEFETHLKKLEAKKFQALADAFKQHDLERETIVQKKLKEYTELEVVLRNSLNEVEKREKLLSNNEAQVARLKADLHHEYENKLMELREASKRVQEKADHQVQLQKSKCENLEEEMMRQRRQIHEWEKKFSDKEAEFLQYKERENGRPEIRLQSELNMLNLEKLELERKLDAMAKARNHYKDQWNKALVEIGNMKKREEANAKATLKKQQLELEHLRLRYLAAEENEINKSEEKRLLSIKNELEKFKMNNIHSNNIGDNICNTNMDLDECMDQNLKDHINRLTEERETLLRTGVYSNSDAIIVELDRRITDCYKEAKNIC